MRFKPADPLFDLVAMALLERGVPNHMVHLGLDDYEMQPDVAGPLPMLYAGILDDDGWMLTLPVSPFVLDAEDPQSAFIVAIPAVGEWRRHCELRDQVDPAIEEALRHAEEKAFLEGTGG